MSQNIAFAAFDIKYDSISVEMKRSNGRTQNHIPTQAFSKKNIQRRHANDPHKFRLWK